MLPPRALSLALALVYFVVGGCQDAVPPLAPEAPPTPMEVADAADPMAAISDAVRGGNAHFFWLPPMVGHPGEFNGPFDGTLEVIVTICDLSNCAGTTIEQFSVTANTVEVSAADETYKAEWDTKVSNATVGTTYRIVVSVAGTEIGFADVVLAASGEEARNLTTDETIGLNDGRTLPIQFRLEEGAVFVIDPAAGGTIEALDGEVEVEVAPGVLTEETGITVEETPPTGTAITAVEFGPDGLEFNEPIRVTIGYDASQFPPGVSESDLVLNLLDDQGRWTIIPGSQVDEALDEVTAEFHHFSTGGVGPAELAIFCSGDGDPDTFETLQEAVDAVMDGGTVEVCDGTHVTGLTGTGPTFVNKAITIEGAVGFRPVLTSNGNRFGMVVGNEPVSGMIDIRNLVLRHDWAGGGNFNGVLFLGDLVDQAIVDDVDLEIVNTGSGMMVNDPQTPGARVVIQYMTATGTAAARNGLYIPIDGDASSVEVRNSSFTDTGRHLLVHNLQPSTARVTIDNVTVSGGSELGVWAINTNGTSPGPLVDVTNSTFDGQAIWYQGGASGLIQGNSFTGCHGSACIRVAGPNPGQSQLLQEAPQVTGNQINLTTISLNARAIWLSSPPIAGWKVTNNQIGGIAPTGDRSDPGIYSFTGTGIRVDDAAGAGIGAGSISDNSVASAFIGIAADGAATVTGLNNVIDGTNTAVQSTNGASLSVQSTDITDYIVPIDPGSGFGTGDLTCNWWGVSTEPVGVDPGISADVYTPWATASVAGTSTTTCSGGP